MKKVVIIGGGVAGLSAGIFAQKNGFESVILEKHHTLGGECTGWDRQGYHIDGCIHWLVGTKQGTPINELWKTVGALDGVDVYQPDSFLTFEHNGTQVNFYRDLERLKSSWLEISPEDEEAINDFCQAIEKLQSFEIPTGKPMDMMNVLEKVKFMLSMKDAGMIMQKYGKISLQAYANSFKHPALRGALAYFVPEDFGASASSIIFAMGSFTKGQAGIPFGGSRALALRMKERYLSLGGAVESPCEVTSLSIENNKVTSVICNNGKTFTADYFIAACDAKVLFERLLKGEYNDPEFEKRYNNPSDYPLASEVRIALGYAGKMDDIPRTLRFPVAPVKVGANAVDYLTLTHYDYEPGFAPEGHSVITVSVNQEAADYEVWQALSQDKGAYREEKGRIGEDVLQAIVARLPHMEGKIKVLDVATPKTFERYCNAYRGSFMAFWPTVRSKELAHTGQIKGLDNIVLSGQWLQPPGGLPTALITGKDTIMRLCKQERKQFKLD
ncbi:phytoene desaturase family protein [Dethiobacter alkaliphilus]|uniref:phytoene desaturase family protein n=1 Tax=Dethiobacter alkaliphilus TaxID=427926 RepID=UPI002227A92C|nr:NAD(P)/FAD-dependent oxidoreductase [Dethiobacter alkaliphilus]MCW3490670.1 NAD(P)/FAD-dependent oxidoreductase [Dethiobacter alkaliphilus]